MSKDVLTEILTGQMSEDVMDDINAVDVWMNASIDQLENGEEPTLKELIFDNESAILAFRASMAAIYCVISAEIEKGKPLVEGIKKSEALVFRFAAALSHKAAVHTRPQDSLFKGLA